MQILSGCSDEEKRCKIRGRATEPADMADRIIPNPESSGLQGPSSGSESDLRELAALFAAHSGGSFSAEVAADLALDIVLSEIAEQACLATGATGAAIILERDGEMVCRASSGANAPEMGARLSSKSGLTAECIRTRQVQGCEDALIDPRADAEASRDLGVRSVLIFPILRNGGLAGVLEVLSSRAGAFGERDEVTLEALAQLILKNLTRASEAAAGAAIHTTEAAGSKGSAEAVPAVLLDGNALDDLPAESAMNSQKEDEVAAEALAQAPRSRVDVVTVSLSAAVLICAVLLATLVGLRVSARKTAGKRAPVVASASRAGTAETNAVSSQGAEARTVPAADDSKVEAKVNAKDPVKTAWTNPTRSSETVPQEGSLLVYENGKEVFRMAPGAERASSVEQAGIVEVLPEGSPVHRVEPEYPEAARQKGIQGAVVLDVRIGRDGAVQDVKVMSGQRVLADAAIAAVKQWRFKPQVRAGQAVEMQTRVTLNFKLPS
jgi:TonB family protein